MRGHFGAVLPSLPLMRKTFIEALGARWAIDAPHPMSLPLMRKTFIEA